MGLSDLKKKPPQTDVPAAPITLDEFINDAELYALGHSRQIMLPGSRIPEPEPPAVSEAQPKEPKGTDEPKAVFKKATVGEVVVLNASKGQRKVGIGKAGCIWAR